MRDKEVEETRNPSLFARIRNKLFPPNPATAKPVAPPEKLNGNVDFGKRSLFCCYILRA